MQIAALQRWSACFHTTGCEFVAEDIWLLLALTAIVVASYKAAVWLAARLTTARAVATTAALSRRLSRWVKTRDYTGDEFFRADGAPDSWVERRKSALDRLAEHFKSNYTKSLAWGETIRTGFSDLRFTDTNRVPFPFVRVMREKFNLSTVVTASNGPLLQDLDGHWTLDVSGSYGVNVAGFERYKEWIERGWAQVKDLGPVLGPLHPVVAENISLLKKISGMDEVSFHMSGTEAVMAAVRLVRFNTRRKLIVCFSGAYHGWWDGVMPGLGNERDISLLRFFQCGIERRRVPFVGRMDRRRHDDAGIEVDRVFGLISKMRRAVLHLGDLRIGIGFARPILVRELLALPLAVEPDKVIDRRRRYAALLSHPRQHLAIGLATVATHDGSQRGVGLHRRTVDADPLTLHQAALGDQVQNPAKDFFMRLMRQAASGLRQPGMVGNLVSVRKPQEIAQRVGIRAAPHNAALAVDALEITDHVHAEIAARRK